MGVVLGDIHVVTDDFVNVYLLVRGGEVVLIDAGLESTWRLLEEYLGGLGLSLGSISTIIVTHHHGDHVGSLRKVAEASGARVAAHVEEAGLIKARTGVDVDLGLRDGDTLHGLRVIHTPGHTPGHIALLDPETRSLFTGDLVHEQDGDLYEIPQKYSMDPEGNRRSIARLLTLDFENLLPSHGSPLLGGGKDKLRSLLERLGQQAF